VPPRGDRGAGFNRAGAPPWTIVPGPAAAARLVYWVAGCSAGVAHGRADTHGPRLHPLD
jgi:hypothetical protein